MRRCSVAKLGSGLEPELVAEPRTRGRIVRERVRLAAGAVEGEHGEPLRPLAQWMLGGEREDVAELLGVAPERELRVDALLERDQTELFETLDLGMGELVVPQLPVGAPTPQSDRPLGERRRESVVALTPCGRGLDDEALETAHVDGLRRSVERIRAGSRRDPHGLGQRLAELRDVHLDELGRRGRGDVPPERLDELVDGARAPVRDDQGAEQPPMLRREGSSPVPTGDLDGPEHPHFPRNHGRPV